MAIEMAARLAAHGYTPEQAANLAWHMILIEMAAIIGVPAEVAEYLVDERPTIH